MFRSNCLAELSLTWFIYMKKLISLMTQEKTATPMTIITDATIISFDEIGKKSPYPTVDNIVNEKYIIVIRFSRSSF